MLFHEFGEHGILALEPSFEGGDLLLVDGLRTFGRPPIVLEGGGAVFEEDFLPVVERVGLDTVLVTQIGDRDLFQVVFAENGDLLLGAKVTTLLGTHVMFLRSGYTNPNGGNSN